MKIIKEYFGLLVLCVMVIFLIALVIHYYHYSAIQLEKENKMVYDYCTSKGGFIVNGGRGDSVCIKNGLIINSFVLNYRH